MDDCNNDNIPDECQNIEDYMTALYADYDGDGLGSSCYKESNYFPYTNDGIYGDQMYNNQVIYQCSDPNDDDGFVDPNYGNSDENTQASFICDPFDGGYNNCDETSNGTWVALQYVNNDDEYCNEYQSLDYDADNDGSDITSDCDDSDENILSPENNPPLYPDWDGDGRGSAYTFNEIQNIYNITPPPYNAGYPGSIGYCYDYAVAFFNSWEYDQVTPKPSIVYTIVRLQILLPKQFHT